MSALAAMLYVPGGDERKVAKAPALDVDAIIYDLEDAVAVSRKDEARRRVRAALAGADAGPPRYVRVNDVHSGRLLDDLEAVAVHGLRGIVLPKVESGEDVRIADWLLHTLERRSGLPGGSTRILPILETPAGVGQAGAIAQASDRVTCLCFGAGDFSRAVGLEWPPLEAPSATLVAAKTALVLASRAHGLRSPHDSVYPDFRDVERLRREAADARALGFGGKHAIHPDQVAVIRRAFEPTERELAWAERVVAAFEESERKGVANVALEGSLVDYPVYERARELLGRGGHDD